VSVVSGDSYRDAFGSSGHAQAEKISRYILYGHVMQAIKDQSNYVRGSEKFITGQNEKNQNTTVTKSNIYITKEPDKLVKLVHGQIV
jgi:hypothetical protein